MLELLFLVPKSLERFHNNPLAAQLELFSSKMNALGYSHVSIRMKVYLLARLGNWISRRKILVAMLNEEVINKFAISQNMSRRRGEYSTLHRFLKLLQEEEIVSTPVVPNKEPLEQLLDIYATYLTNERGLTDVAFARYHPFIKKFIVSRFSHIDAIRPADVVMFVATQSKTMARKRAQLMTSSLKSFFRFLLQKGIIKIDLAAAVPSVANWNQVAVPKSLPPALIEHLIRTCRKKRSHRDFAIILLLSRLGLRACEIVRMELDDIDWQAGEFLVRGKGKAFERLPMPQDVGKALAHYLQFERPSSATRKIFIRSRAPHLGLANSIAICTIVSRLMIQAKIKAPTKGISSHLFRHSLATKILKRGGSLIEISQILRHKSQTTTEIYAKVDIEGLRSLAQIWPKSGVTL
jgi:site-specific recombinase XerD